MLIPDRSEKTVVIPILVVGGQLRYFYGGSLPTLPDRTICDLIAPAWAVKDTEFEAKLQIRHVEDFLPEGAVVYTAVSSARIPDQLTSSALRPEEIGQRVGGHRAEQIVEDLKAWYPYFRFVEVVLKQPLGLELRGTKPAALQPVRCQIPALEWKEATSLNAAYRLISLQFEPQRISNAGNVFLKMFYLDPQGRCTRLKDLREEFAARHESALYPAP